MQRSLLEAHLLLEQLHCSSLTHTERDHTAALSSLTGTAYQRALHSHPMKQNSDRRTEGITEAYYFTEDYMYI